MEYTWKRPFWLRIAAIGCLHTFVYLYLIPFVVFPQFGRNGLLCVTICAVIISITIMGSMWTGKKFRKKYGEKHEQNNETLTMEQKIQSR